MSDLVCDTEKHTLHNPEDLAEIERLRDKIKRSNAYREAVEAYLGVDQVRRKELYEQLDAADRHGVEMIEKCQRCGWIINQCVCASLPQDDDLEPVLEIFSGTREMLERLTNLDVQEQEKQDG